jgi:twitching motility protein PilT
LVLVGGEKRRHAVSAGIIGAYSRDFTGHVVSVEAPLRYQHKNARAAISQREVGVDCASRGEAIAALPGLDADMVVLDDAGGAGEVDPVLYLVEEGALAVISLAVPAGEDIVRAFCRRFGPGREADVARRVAAVLRAVVRVPREGEVYVEPLGADRRSQLHAGVIMPVLGWPAAHESSEPI